MQTRKLWWVALYAVAMAYIEAATVVYLRRLYGIADLVRDVVPYDPALASTEMGRELATLVMLLAVGWAAGRSSQSRLGFTFFAFGLWDILYYGWLRVLIGWPGSLLAPDILFFIPLPWWGPVLTPVLIAVLGTVTGALMVAGDDRGRATRLGLPEGAALGAGAIAVLYAFLADALASLPASAESLSRLRPAPFRWPAYIIGLAAMAWAAWRTTWRVT